LRSLKTIQLWTAKIPFQRTVRAENTRTSASGCSEAAGSQAGAGAVRALPMTERSPSQYFAADTPIGTASANK